MDSKQQIGEEMDECFNDHDECYGSGQDPCSDEPNTKKCDRELIKCLLSLNKDPRKWPRPAKDPIYADFYSGWAIGGE